MAAARDRVLFTDYGIRNSLEGRFESLCIVHSAIILLKLQTLPEPGPKVAQDVADALFRHFDAALREMGVGDISVPKRMKTIAEAYLGRTKAYQDAFGKIGFRLPPRCRVMSMPARTTARGWHAMSNS